MWDGSPGARFMVLLGYCGESEELCLSVVRVRLPVHLEITTS